MINLIFSLLVLSAIIISLLLIGFLILWLRGADSLAFPGLGLIVSTPLFTVLLMILQFIIIIGAIFIARYKSSIPSIMVV
jgi:hypothetical protein